MFPAGTLTCFHLTVKTTPLFFWPRSLLVEYVELKAEGGSGNLKLTQRPTSAGLMSSAFAATAIDWVP